MSPTGRVGDQPALDHVLTECFGFEAQTAKEIRATEHEEKDAKTGKVEVSKLEHYGVRWLSKGLGAYGPVGWLGDAVNLVLAMQNEAQPKDVSSARSSPRSSA